MIKGRRFSWGVEKEVERVSARPERELNIVVKRAVEREVHRGKNEEI